MNMLQVTTKTSDQIEAAFAAVFSAIEPSQARRPVTQADRLAPYRKAIMRQRRRGLTWKQIAAAMADPRINEPVTEKLLRKVFGGQGKSAQAPTPTLPPTSAPSALER